MNRKLLAWMMASCMALSAAAPAFAVNEGEKGDGTTAEPGTVLDENAQVPVNNAANTEEEQPTEDAPDKTVTGKDDQIPKPDGETGPTPGGGEPEESVQIPAGGQSGETGGEELPTETASDEAAKLMEALPAVDDVMNYEPVLSIPQEDPGYNDAYNAAFKARVDEVKEQAAKAREAYGKLTDEEKAVFDAALLAKLADLEAFFDPQAQPTTFDNSNVTTAGDLKTALGTGGDITLGGNIADISETLKVDTGKTVTLDLGDHTLSGSATILEVSGTLILRSSGSGKITSSVTRTILVKSGGSLTIESGFIESTGGDAIRNNGSLTVKGGTIKSNNVRNGIQNIVTEAGKKVTCVIDGGQILGGNWGIGLLNLKVAANAEMRSSANDDLKLIINGGTIGVQTAEGDGISTNYQNPGFTLVINGGTIDAVTNNGNCALYLPGRGNTTINGGTIKGNTQGVQIPCGTLKITGGDISCVKSESDNTITSGGSGKACGAVVVGKAQKDYSQPANVNISGGTIENKSSGNSGNAIVISDQALDENVENINVRVTGGAIKGSVSCVSSNSSNPIAQAEQKLSLTLSGANISGNVNLANKGNVAMSNTSVSGSVINSSSGKISGTGNYIQGNVNNSSDGNINLAETTVNGTTTGNNVTVTKPVYRPSTGGNSGSGSSGGSGGGSGSNNKGASIFSKLTNTINGILKGNLTGVPAVSNTGAVPAAGVPITETAASKAVAAAIQNAKQSKKETAQVVFRDASTISTGVIASIVSQAQKAGLSANLSADSMDGNAVSVRLSMDAAGAARTGKDLNLFAKVGSEAIQRHFAKYYSSKTAVIEMGQKGPFGTLVTVAARVPLNGMDTSRLRFHSFDSEENAYYELPQTAYFVDANGYLHFTTDAGNYLIVSEGQLTLK